MFLKSILLTSVILHSYIVFFGQSAFPYDQEWKLIDSLINKKNLPKSALVEVNKVYTAAKKDKQEAQWVKAIIYKNHLQAIDQNINDQTRELETEVLFSPPGVAALLKSIEAEELFQYLQGHRYQMRSRTTVVADTSSDITTWTVSRLSRKIANLFLSSLDKSDLLKKKVLDNFNPVLILGNASELRPTLYDLLAWRALDYFRVDDPEPKSSDVNKFWENPVLFSEAPFFMHYGFDNKDSLSNQLTALKLFQQLLRFHAKDVRLDAWIDADISRIQFAYQNAQIPEKDSLYLNALNRITRQFGTLSTASRAWYLQAQWWANQAGSYDPLGDSLHRYDNLKAVAICKQVINHPDSSDGKSSCELLLENIRHKSINLNIEQVNLPNLPFRALVTYKNVNHLYGRIIRIDDATKESFQRNVYDQKFWAQIIRMPFEKNFQQAIPETQDYQQHSVEIKVDQLQTGQYALLVSSDSSFSNSAILGINTFFSSSIAFIQNGLDYFVVDRNSGKPLKGVRVKTFFLKYGNGGNIYRPSKTYLTDGHGYFQLLADKQNPERKMEFYNGNDYLSSSHYFSYYQNDANKDDKTDQKSFEKEQLKNYLYTDRSIYRPGQTIFFKGLLITKDFNSRKFKTVVQHQAKIYLVDANNENIDSLVLKSNDFGSIQGYFKLPDNLLNGEFNIHDEETGDDQTVSVEEYKRPSFYVEYDTLKNSYRVGDTIKLQGSASAYAGNSIDQSILNWHVIRESRFPYPWLFRKYPSNSETEIAHGESKTDSNGKFIISFTASPDKKVNSSTKPVYTYRIETTVTDLNGESRSATTSIYASYQSFEITSALPEKSRILKDSLFQIPVTTKNSSNVFVREKLTVSVYALEAPNRLVRNRYWREPDQFVMSETEYIGLFPNDEYRNETDIQSWRQGSAVYEKTDSTRKDGLFEVDRKVLSAVKSGWYVIEFKARGNDGKNIIDKRYLEIVDNSGKPGEMAYNIFPVEYVSSEPGMQVRIQTGSDAGELFVIRAKQYLDSSTKYFFYNLSREIISSEIKINESDRGGFGLNDIFVKNNRWYASDHIISVYWTNKELQFSYQTWKNKVQPGSQEQWKIKISGNKRELVTSELLTSMYDASLDQFKNHTWEIPHLYPMYKRIDSWSGGNNFGDAASWIRPDYEFRSISNYQNEYDKIIKPGMSRGAGKTMMAFNDYGIMRKKDVTGALNSETAGIPMPQQGYVADSVGKNENASDKKGSDLSSGDVQIRKNFNETAFFKPDLKTDALGNIEINFTIPDALTKWKWMLLANSRDLSFGYAEKFVVTQKELMLQTNMPRFFREGDTLLLPVKIANLSSQSMNGTVRLEWLDAGNNRSLDSNLSNISSTQSFSVSASQSAVVSFPTIVPAHFNQSLLYRIAARTNMKDADYSDGEENVIPVLSNRMLVTESLPLNMEGKEEKHFVFEKLLKSRESASLQNQSLTVEYTSNPVWYAVQSLPYLMEFPYECAEQTFNRFYANALASHIVQVSPGLQAIFEKWKNTDTTALLSNLQKNEELKSVLLRETPWVLQAQTESQQKKNIALLFDLIKMRGALKLALDKLKQMQSEAGGFAWFKGGRDDRYITQYIISGIGRLRKLKAIPADQQDALNKIARSGIAFLDREINSDYVKRDKSPVNQHLDPIQIQYLYMRSFFPDVDVPRNIFNALNYFRRLSTERWIKEPVYMQGMIAVFLNRTGDVKSSKDILASLKENASNSPELGTYWKSVKNGFYWQEAPVETQSLLIEVFLELHADQNAIDQMKYWLLQQKHSSHWPTTKATADACYALLLNGGNWLASEQTVSIQLGAYQINSNEVKSEAGTGYFKKQIPGDQVLPDMGNIQVNLSQKTDATPNAQRLTPNAERSSVIGQPSTANPSWGAIYWQYFENLDKITTAQTQLSINKNLFIEKNSDKGPVLEAVSEKNILKPGDKLKMRIIIKSDRDLEYVHLKDMRAACLEPVNVLSGYQWQGGLGYYQTTQDASTSFFFDHLSKGTYVFEYPVFVTTSGNYSNGIGIMECMYAPEFAAHSEGMRLHVESK